MKYLPIIGLLFFASCNKDSVTISNTIFINNTSHSISVFGYNNGLLNQESSFDLNANDIKTVFTLNNRGIGEGLSFGEYFRPVDSFVVIFDNSFKITHYKPTLIGNNPKNYLFGSNRNIYNDSNYTNSIIIDKKFRREWNFEYTFIEQDFLDAN